MPNITQGPFPASVASGWLNSNRIFVQDGSYATFPLTHGQTSNTLIATGFGFNIPLFATILGILAVVVRGDIGGTLALNNTLAQLLKAGVGVGSNKDGPVGSAWGVPPETVNYGSPGDLWGTGWLPSDINNAGFGFQLQVKDTDPSVSDTAGVDFVSLSVTYSINTSFFGVVNTE
jgi:hypothetical protein